MWSALAVVMVIVPTILGATFAISACGLSTVTRLRMDCAVTSNACLIMEENFSRSREEMVLKVYPVKA